MIKFVFLCLFVYFITHVSLKNLLTKKNYMDIVLLLSLRVVFLLLLLFIVIYIVSCFQSKAIECCLQTRLFGPQRK